MSILFQLQFEFYNSFIAGKWSADPPRCSPIRCVALEILDAHLRVLALNNTYRGLATFLCPFGYRLVGPDSIKCGHEGRWTGSVPSCKGKKKFGPPRVIHNKIITL